MCWCRVRILPGLPPARPGTVEESSSAESEEDESQDDDDAEAHTGRWFGCHDFYFPTKIGFLIIPIDELIFFRGVQTTNQHRIGWWEILRVIGWDDGKFDTGNPNQLDGKIPGFCWRFSRTNQPFKKGARGVQFLVVFFGGAGPGHPPNLCGCLFSRAALVFVLLHVQYIIYIIYIDCI